jgi:uncharacterized protein (TIGR03437 family)
MKFQSSVAGNVTGVRFYKGSQNTGTHIGHVWSRTGALLGTVTFTGESASGWQQATFASPVAIAANTTYVISYRAPVGHYADDSNFFSSSVSNGSLTALRNGQDGSNGVYAYGSSTTFPSSTWSSSNYWVDVLFQPGTGTATASVMTAKLSETTAGQGRGRGALLSCAPKVVHAGESFDCELQQADGTQPAELSADGAIGVLLPATTGGRNRSNVRFRGSVTQTVPQQSVTMAAVSRGERVEETIAVLAGADPAISAPGDQLVKYGTPVAFKVTADSATVGVQELPAGASFDPSTGQFAWTPGENQQGISEVTFVAGSAKKTLRITVDGGIPAAGSRAVVCSPGGIASIDGRWLGPNDPAADASGASQELGGTSVRVEGVAVPVLYADQGRVSFLCPAGQPGDSLDIAVQTPSGTVVASGTMQYASPALLSLEGSDQGLIYDSATAELAAVQDVRSSGQPAEAGDRVIIRATGLGNGLRPEVKIGGIGAQVESVKASTEAAGVWDVEVVVPAGSGAGDRVPVQMEMVTPDGRQLQSNTVSVAIDSTRR